MDLSVDQRRAYDVIQGRLHNGEGLTCLTGYAGTGKTTLIGHLINALYDQGQPVFVTTPTHKSAQVLRTVLAQRAVQPQTIHSFLGLLLRPDGSGGYALQWDGRTRPPKDGIVFVDEASMIGRDLWKHVEAADHLQWVFVGDPAQLPPVNEAPSPALSVPGVQLDAIVRQAAGNPILRMASAIREGRTYLHESAYVDERGVATTSSPHKFMESITRSYAGWGAQEPPEVRVLAYRNAVVRRYNAAIRAVLHGGSARERFVAGEWLMMIDTYFEFGRPVAFNSEEVRVERVEEAVVGLIGSAWRTHMIVAQLGTRSVTLPVLHHEEFERFESVLSSLREEAARGSRAWTDYYELREGFARLDYTYSLTIHKSQGSTFETVYVDHRDAVRSPVRERRSLLYVAVTRPSRRLALLI